MELLYQSIGYFIFFVCLFFGFKSAKKFNIIHGLLTFVFILSLVYSLLLLIVLILDKSSIKPEAHIQANTILYNIGWVFSGFFALSDALILKLIQKLIGANYVSFANFLQTYKFFIYLFGIVYWIPCKIISNSINFKKYYESY